MRTPKRISSVASAAAVATLLAAAGTGLAANRTGTGAGETLTGTHDADKITGKGGDDLLKGLAGNDVYLFGNGSGVDTIQEKVTYTVAGKRKPGGKDTLSFAQATGRVEAYLIPEGGAVVNTATQSDGSQVVLGTSRVEHLVGINNPDPQVFDYLAGGAGPNVLDDGGGYYDVLIDLGGFAGDDYTPPLPASSDTFKGVAMNQFARVTDVGGAKDVVDLKPLNRGDVGLTQADAAGDRVEDDLVILSDNNTTVVFGHFATGQIEQFVFSNATVASGEIVAANGEAGSAAAARALARAPAPPDGLPIRRARR